MSNTPKKLTRSHDRKLAGVCGGLAEYLNIDPTLARIGMVLLVIFGSLGIWAYLILWLLMPECD